NFVQMVVKNLIDHHSLYVNPSLGAPFGQELYDYPSAAANMSVIALLGIVGAIVRDSAATLNLVYLLGYPLAALSAYLVLRSFRVSFLAATVGSVLFALAPY